MSYFKSLRCGWEVSCVVRNIISLFLLLVFVEAAYAHKPSDSYLSLQVSGRQIVGQWDIALRDLDFAMALDADGNGEITWGEVQARHDDIAAYAMTRLELHGNGNACGAKVNDHLIDNHTDGAYAVLRFAADCSNNLKELGVAYKLFFEIDPQHKGLLQLRHDSETYTAIFSPDMIEQKFSLERRGQSSPFLGYLVHGVEHIWAGYDHILFLISLLLPAVVLRAKGAWMPMEGFDKAFLEVVRVVTAFTIAHSITLALAALDFVSIPSRITESVIAISIVIAALNNLFPIIEGRRWAVAFGFGLLHGFGFASVLQDLGLPKNALVLALIGFNVGVEVGQLAIVAVFLPLAFLLRSTLFYRKAVIVGGSTTIIILATLWFTERVFGLEFMPF